MPDRGAQPHWKVELRSLWGAVSGRSKGLGLGASALGGRGLFFPIVGPALLLRPGNPGQSSGTEPAFLSAEPGLGRAGFTGLFAVISPALALGGGNTSEPCGTDVTSPAFPAPTLRRASSCRGSSPGGGAGRALAAGAADQAVQLLLQAFNPFLNGGGTP